MDLDNEDSKIFIISLRLIGRTGRETFIFSGPHSEIQLAQFTNHTVRTY